MDINAPEVCVRPWISWSRTSAPSGWSLSTDTRSMGTVTAGMIEKVNSRCYGLPLKASEIQREN